MVRKLRFLVSSICANAETYLKPVAVAVSCAIIVSLAFQAHPVFLYSQGVPEPRPDHAIVMTRFARDCMAKIKVLTRELEVTLGPDTADLTIRFVHRKIEADPYFSQLTHPYLVHRVGLHSGPVTAGVLRGRNPRFQLFVRVLVPQMIFSSLTIVLEGRYDGKYTSYVCLCPL